jgi:DNA/RNA endonuclease G (NUC1)
MAACFLVVYVAGEATTQQCSVGGAELLSYDGFHIWHDCERRAAIKFEYSATKDVGDLKRKGSFTHDPKYPKECQQTSKKGYGEESIRVVVLLTW